MSNPPNPDQLSRFQGTGAVLALPLLRSAAAVMSDMASLEDVMKAGAAGSSEEGA
jgi:hypothetical protein